MFGQKIKDSGQHGASQLFRKFEKKRQAFCKSYYTCETFSGMFWLDSFLSFVFCRYDAKNEK